MIKKFKHNRRIVCYVFECNGRYEVHTGKPSDRECIGWTYDNIDDAMFTANEFFNNVTNIKLI